MSRDRHSRGLPFSTPMSRWWYAAAALLLCVVARGSLAAQFDALNPVSNAWEDQEGEHRAARRTPRAMRDCIRCAPALALTPALRRSLPHCCLSAVSPPDVAECVRGHSVVFVW
jgi:hypothetical protein